MRGGGGPERPSGRGRAVAAVVAVVLALGGCASTRTTGEVTGVLTGFVLGGGRGGEDGAVADGGGSGSQAPALVPAEEKERIGYEQPEGERNSALMRSAMAHRAQIFEVVQPHVERMLRREVVMTGLSAPYPFRAVNVHWRTVDEPVVAGSELAYLEADGSLWSADMIDPQSGTAVDWETVSGLYLMAYRDEVTAIREHLEATYLEFTGLPQGYRDAWRLDDPVLQFDLRRTAEDDLGERMRAAIEGIYAAFRERPDRSDAEWREVFDAAVVGVEVEVVVRLMLRDPEEALREERVREIADDLDSNPLLAGYEVSRVEGSSNLLLREGSDFHHEISFDRGIDPDNWIVGERRDGATVRP